MLERDVHPSKALFPMEVTDSGTVMLVRLEQSWKALSPIAVTIFPLMECGILRAVMVVEFFKLSVAEILPLLIVIKSVVIKATKLYSSSLYDKLNVGSE